MVMMTMVQKDTEHLLTHNFLTLPFILRPNTRWVLRERERPLGFSHERQDYIS